MLDTDIAAAVARLVAAGVAVLAVNGREITIGDSAQRDAGGDVPVAAGAAVLRRDLAFDVRAAVVNRDARTVELSFSSEAPFERYWGVEILDHGPNSIELGRLMNRAALLVNHDPDCQVGVVESVTIGADRVGRAVVRFGKSPAAEEVYQDVLDGIRGLTSVGYQIKALVLESSSGGVDTYRVTKWEPYEISLVSIPADPSVGVDRENGAANFDPRALLAFTEEEDQMRMNRNAAGLAAGTAAAALAAAGTETAAAGGNPPAVPAAPAVNAEAIRNAAVAAERERQLNIRSIASRIPAGAQLADQAIADGWEVGRFAAEIERSIAAPAVPTQLAEGAAIGLTAGDAARFNFMRFLCAIDPRATVEQRRAAKFELEISAAAGAFAEANGYKVRGGLVPFEVMAAHRAVDPRAAALYAAAQRDLVVGTSTAGGHLVQTAVDGANYIEVLRARSIMVAAGAKVLNNLTGNLSIPRQTAGATGQWVAENAAPTESQPAFDQVTLTPKHFSAYVDIARQLMLQSSVDVSNLVLGDLAAAVATGVDTAAIAGSGSSNQPRGVINTSGIGSVAGGTNGLAPTYANIVDLESAVAVANADVGALGYLTNAKMRGRLKQTQQFAGTNGAAVWNGNEVNGYRGLVSNNVPSTLTKGSSSGICSAILFGNWADVLIGMWGSVDFLVDPYTASSTGATRIRVFQTCDVAVRHPESFAAMLDAL